MTKSVTTICIDSEVLKQAKSVIPNLSGFIEDRLRERLYKHGDPRVLKDQIKGLEDELEMAKRQFDVANKDVETRAAEAVAVLRDILNTTGTIPTNILEHWCNVTGYTKEDLLKKVTK